MGNASARELCDIRRGSLKEDIHTRTIVKRVQRVVTKPVLTVRNTIRSIIFLVLGSKAGEIQCQNVNDGCPYRLKAELVSLLSNTIIATTKNVSRKILTEWAVYVIHCPRLLVFRQ
jgi:hypothetical protein